MSTVSELVATRPDDPGFDIVRAAVIELHVADLVASERFYSELLGMIVTTRTEDAVFLRGWEEPVHHSLVLRQAGVTAAASLGFRVRSETDLDRIVALAEAKGLASRWLDAGSDPGIGRRLKLWDPFGYPLEFFHQIDVVETQHQRFDLHRGAPLLRFDHLNIHCADMNDAFAWWLALGFACTEYISTDDPQDEKLIGAWLTRKPSVHDLALTAGTGPRLHHFAYWVADPTGVLRACDQLAGGCHADVIERGPGRHGVSNAFFVYLRDPDGHRIELYSCDYYTGDPGHVPLRWSVRDSRCRSFWGTKAPDSWFEESSLVLGPDGQPTPTHRGEVDERQQRSEVMA